MESWGCEFLELETPSDFAIESKKVYYLPISLVDLMVDEIEISNILRKDRDYIEQLKYEIRKYGLLQPGLVLLATNGVILKDGNHRYCALKEIGYKKYPVNIRVSDARLKVRAGYYPEVLLEILERL